MRLGGSTWEEVTLIWSAADLMGGDESPAGASESEEERRIQMASLRTWREAGHGWVTNPCRVITDNRLSKYFFFTFLVYFFLTRHTTLFSLKKK